MSTIPTTYRTARTGATRQTTAAPRRTPARPAPQDALLRVVIPLTPTESALSPGSFTAIDLHALMPQYACETSRSFRLSFAGRGLAIESTRAAVYTVSAGTELHTVRPGRRLHTQAIDVDSLVAEVGLPDNSPIARLARQLAGREVRCRLDASAVRTRWATSTTRGSVGEPVLQTEIEAVDGLVVGQDGSPAFLSVI